jgi:UrcA family protein
MNQVAVILAASALVLLVGTAPAHAKDNVVTKSIVVKYGDLDVSTSAGGQALHNRIAKAARKACRDLYRDSGIGKAGTGPRTCVQQAIEKAVEKVDRPTLWAAHRSSNGALSG